MSRDDFNPGANNIDSFGSSTNEKSFFENQLEKRDTVHNLDDSIALTATYYRGGAVSSNM